MSINKYTCTHEQKQTLKFATNSTPASTQKHIITHTYAKAQLPLKNVLSSLPYHLHIHKHYLSLSFFPSLIHTKKTLDDKPINIIDRQTYIHNPKYTQMHTLMHTYLYTQTPI